MSNLEPPAWPAGTTWLREPLESLLAGHGGRHRRIIDLRRARSEYASSHRLENVDVDLDDGATLELVLKGCGAQGMLADARRIRPAFLEHPRREEALYASILDAAGAHVPRFYGALSLPSHGVTALVLERIEGLELRRVGELCIWTRAAACLARMHCGLTRRLGQIPAHCWPPLLTYSHDYYQRWMGRAVDALPRVRELSPAEDRAIRRLTASYGRIAGQLASLPRVVIHGDAFPSNVLVTGGCHQRICFVDWELAGSGPGLVDVAALAAGSWGASEREALLRAYRGGLVEAGVQAPSLDEMMTLLDLCRLHLALQLLGWSSDWAPPSEQDQDWLAETLRMARRLGL